MRRLFSISLVLFFTLNVSFGQSDSISVNHKNLKHSLGIGAGFTTSIGLSYRYSFNKFKVQTTFTPIKDNYSSNYHIGLTAILNLVETKNTNFYLYQGNYFHYEKISNSDRYYYGSYSDGEIINRTWNHGLGIGIEFIILKRIGFNLMGGYAGYDGFDRIGLTGETGLYYMF